MNEDEQVMGKVAINIGKLLRKAVSKIVKDASHFEGERIMPNSDNDWEAVTNASTQLLKQIRGHIAEYFSNVHTTPMSMEEHREFLDVEVRIHAFIVILEAMLETRPNTKDATKIWENTLKRALEQTDSMAKAADEQIKKLDVDNKSMH